MAELIKHELNRQKRALLLIGSTPLLAQALLFAGLLFDDTNMAAAGLMTTLVLGIFAILYMGFESIVAFHRDLKRKRGFVLFLASNSAYKTLGTKLLCNGLTLLLAGILFAALLMFDGVAISIRYEGFDELIQMLVNQLTSIAGIKEDIRYSYILLGVMAMLIDWIAVVAEGHFVAALCVTFWPDHKYNRAISVVIFILLEVFTNRVFRLFHVPEGTLSTMPLSIAYYFAIMVLCYEVSGWILEKKFDKG